MFNQKDRIFKPAKITIYVFVVVISIVLGFIILALISSTGNNEYKEEAVTNCVALCKIELAKGAILNSGPCLSNNVAPGWVCDIVSRPKNKLIDDLPDNQCQAYRNKTVKHFVELTPECDFVRTN